MLPQTMEMLCMARIMWKDQIEVLGLASLAASVGPRVQLGAAPTIKTGLPRFDPQHPRRFPESARNSA